MLLVLGGDFLFISNFSTFFFFFWFFFYLFIYLFMAVLGLRFCARAFSSCGKRGPLFIAVRGASHYRGLSCCGAQAPDAQAQQLWPTGPVAPRHVGSSQTRARTRVPRTGRQTLNHCATREAQTSVPLTKAYAWRPQGQTFLLENVHRSASHFRASHQIKLDLNLEMWNFWISESLR